MTGPAYRTTVVGSENTLYLVICDLGDPGSPPDPDAIADILHEWHARCRESLLLHALLRDADGCWHAIQHARCVLAAQKEGIRFNRVSQADVDGPTCISLPSTLSRQAV